MKENEALARELMAVIFGVAYNTFFNIIYYALLATSILILIGTVIVGIRKRQSLVDKTYRKQALGIQSAAFCTASSFDSIASVLKTGQLVLKLSII